MLFYQPRLIILTLLRLSQTLNSRQVAKMPFLCIFPYNPFSKRSKRAYKARKYDRGSSHERAPRMTQLPQQSTQQTPPQHYNSRQSSSGQTSPRQQMPCGWTFCPSPHTPQRGPLPGPTRENITPPPPRYGNHAEILEARLEHRDQDFNCRTLNPNRRHFIPSEAPPPPRATPTGRYREPRAHEVYKKNYRSDNKKSTVWIRRTNDISSVSMSSAVGPVPDAPAKVRGWTSSGNGGPRQQWGWAS